MARKVFGLQMLGPSQGCSLVRLRPGPVPIATRALKWYELAMNQNSGALVFTSK